MSAIMASLRGARLPGRWARLSPDRAPRYWAAAAFVVAAGFAGAVALFSSNDIHRLWGETAACAYVASVVAVLFWRSRGIDLALLLSVSGALITPLFLNAASGRKQPEVVVIARSAKQLVSHHSPYLGAATLAAVHNPNAYDPYLPVMSLFGIPRALFGAHVITDPRVWFGAAFVVVFWLALRARSQERAALDRDGHRVPGDRAGAGCGGDRHPDPGPAVPWVRAAVAAAAVRAGRGGAGAGVGGQGHRLAGGDRGRCADRDPGRPAAVPGVPGLGPGRVRGGGRAGGGGVAVGTGGQYDLVPAGAGGRAVGGGQPAAGARPRQHWSYRAPDR